MKGRFSCFADLPFPARLKSKGHCCVFVSCCRCLLRTTWYCRVVCLSNAISSILKMSVSHWLLSHWVVESTHAAFMQALIDFSKHQALKLAHLGSVKERLNSYHSCSRVRIWQGTEWGKKLPFTTLSVLWQARSSHVRRLTVLSVVRHLFIHLHILPGFGHAANYEKQVLFISARSSRHVSWWARQFH